jgi:hypothetical protein
MIMNEQSESGITRAALATALLFLLTTVIVAVWGGMQYRALRASDAQREALGQRLDALRQEASQMQPTAAPAVPMSAPVEAQTPAPPAAPSSPQPSDPPVPSFGLHPEIKDESVADIGAKSGESMPRDKIMSMVESRFGQFLAGLAPEQQSQIRPLLVSFTEACAATTEEDMLRTIFIGPRLEQELRGELSRVLSAKEMDFYDDCQHSVAKEYILGTMYFHPTEHTDADTRAAARSIMAEEIIAAQARALKIPPRHIGPQSILMVEQEVKNEAMRNARTQLARILSPEGMRAFDQYIEEGLALYEASREMERVADWANQGP